MEFEIRRGRGRRRKCRKIAKAPKIITCVVGLSNSVNIQYSAKIAYAIKPISRFLKQYTYPNKMENSNAAIFAIRPEYAKSILDGTKKY